MATNGKYELVKLLGAGATADVYLANDTLLGRQVALKLLKPALISDAPAFARFAQEARAAAGLFHPHIATVLDMGELDGRYYIAMRLVDGPSLDQKLRQAGAPLPPADVIQMAQQIGSALDYAHSKGFIHRDVKPANILCEADGSYLLTDFGLTRALMSSGLTSHTGAVLGTPSYIAPEIWLNQPATPATDQYALACVIYEALTGQILFTGDTPPAIMTAHVLNGSIALKRLPGAYQSVMARALDKEPAKRYPSIGTFTQALASPYQFGRQVEAAPDRTAQAPSQALSSNPTSRLTRPASSTSTPGQPEPVRRALSTAARPGQPTGPAKKTPWLLIVGGAGLLGLCGLISLVVFLYQNLGGTLAARTPTPDATQMARLLTQAPSDPNIIYTRAAQTVQAAGPTATTAPSNADPTQIAQILTQAAAPTSAPSAPEPTATSAGFFQLPTATTAPSLAMKLDGWSHKISYTAIENGLTQVYAINPDGSGLSLFSGEPASLAFPAWTPDGQSLAFLSRPEGVWKVTVMNASISTPVQLTHDQAGDGNPTWWWDGNRLAFTSYRDGNAEIYMMNPVGTGQVNLSQNPANDAAPDCSPDGKKIAFMSDRDGQFEIYVMDIDGLNQARLTPTESFNAGPTWSPDAKRIAFTSTRDGNEEIYVMNANGSNPVNLTKNSGNDGTPAWSPDGSQIAFISYRDGNAELYVMNADGSNQVRLTYTSAEESYPVWVP